MSLQSLCGASLADLTLASHDKSEYVDGVSDADDGDAYDGDYDDGDDEARGGDDESGEHGCAMRCS